MYSTALIGGVRCPNLTAMTGLSTDEGNGSVSTVKFHVRITIRSILFNKGFYRRIAEQDIDSHWRPWRPFLGQNSSIFMQLSVEIWSNNSLVPPLELALTSGKFILDPPLLAFEIISIL